MPAESNAMSVKSRRYLRRAARPAAAATRATWPQRSDLHLNPKTSCWASTTARKVASRAIAARRARNVARTRSRSTSANCPASIGYWSRARSTSSCAKATAITPSSRPTATTSTTRPPTTPSSRVTCTPSTSGSCPNSAARPASWKQFKSSTTTRTILPSWRQPNGKAPSSRSAPVLESFLFSFPPYRDNLNHSSNFFTKKKKNISNDSSWRFQKFAIYFASVSKSLSQAVWRHQSASYISRVEEKSPQKCINCSFFPGGISWKD